MDRLSNLMGTEKTQSQGKNPKMRRSYSRNGCLQCKKRRQKCDEAKPRCLECSANGTDCSYKKLLKFHDRRSFTVKDSKLDNINGVTNTNDEINITKPKTSKTQRRSHKIYQELVSSSFPKSTIKLSTKEPTIDLFCDRLPEVVENHNDISSIPSFGNMNIDALFDRNSSIPGFPSIDLMNSNTNETYKPSSKLSQIELENSLFDGASNLITDLNSLINSFEVNFSPPELTYTSPLQNHQNQNSMMSGISNVNLQPGRYIPTLADIKFQGISPTNYSVDSESVVTDDQIAHNLHTNNNNDVDREGENDDNDEDDEYDEDDDDDEDDDEVDNEPRNRYIQTLTKSLENYKDHDKSEERHKLEKSPVNQDYIGNFFQNSVFGPTDIDERKAFPCPSKNMLIPFDFIEMLKKTKPENITECLASFFNWSPDSSHTKYLKIFVTYIHLNLIPFSTNYTHNAYMNIFLRRAKDAPHLLFAILAISARFEVYQLEQNSDTPNHEEKLKYHNSFRTYYLSSCLKSLESILHSKQTTLNNIESLLLTIQVLASDFSGNKGSQWRTHLHGAKDLLVKYCRYRPLSLDLTIVWLWFYSMEVLASLTSPNGGAVHEFSEMDEFLPVLCPKVPQYLKDFRASNLRLKDAQNRLLEPGRLTETLIYMGISVPGTLSNSETSRFNMYLGYDETMLEVFNMLIYGIECLRKDRMLKEENQRKDQISIDSSDDEYLTYRNKILVNCETALNSDYFLSLCALIKKARTFKYISNTPPYVISLTSDYHPYRILSEVLDSESNTSSVLDKVLISTYIHPKQSTSRHLSQLDPHNTQPYSGNKVFEAIEKYKSELYFSWIDLAQQLNVDASYLRLLTLPGGIQEHGVNIKSPVIQDVVKRMISGLYGLVRFKDETPDGSNNTISNFHLLEERYKKLFVSTDESNWPKFSFDKFLNYQFDNRLVMVQWPLYVCGLCCIDIRHKALIECCFTGLIGLGAGSGEISLKKLQKIWTLQKLGEFDYNSYNLFGHGFAESNDDDDYVPFM